MLHHVMSRGNNKGDIFADDIDYKHFLEQLAKATARFRVRCIAYCLMPNHVHLLLRPSTYPLSRMMQQLNSAFCQSFNRRHGRVGHVLQGRFKSVIVESDHHFLRVVRYIVRNPVAADLARHPGDWIWSSYRATAGSGPVPAFLELSCVWQALSPHDFIRAQEQFVAFVAAAADDELLRHHVVVGSRQFARSLEPMLAPFRSNADFVYSERFAARPPLSALLPDGRACMARYGARRAFYEYAYTLREIGEHVGRPAATVWSWIHAGQRGQISIF
jgi:putative transposase